MRVSDILLASVLVVYIAIAAILVRQYLRTRNAGFVWLGIAVVIWPVISRLLEGGQRLFIDRVIHHRSVFYPFTLVARGRMTMGSLVMSFAVFEQIVRVCLLLVAVLYLARAKNHRYSH